MDADDVRAAEQLVLVDALGAPLLGALGRQVLAPGDRLHADGGADLGDLGAEIAEPDDAERAPVEIEADGGLPAAAGAHGVELLAQVAGHGQHQADGELGGGEAAAAAVAAARAAHHHLAVGGGGHVDGGVALAGGHQQPQLGQPLEQRARHRHALAHHAHHVEVGQRAGGGVDIVEALVEHHHLVVLLQARPVGHAQGDILVIVEYGYRDHGGVSPLA